MSELANIWMVVWKIFQDYNYVPREVNAVPDLEMGSREGKDVWERTWLKAERTAEE